MRNFVKKLLFFSLFFAAGGAFSAPIDGVHQCTATALGKSATLFLMVHSGADGQTVWVPINPANKNLSWGYGVGSLNGSSYTGLDESANAFTLTLSGTSFSGTFINKDSAGNPFTVSVACVRYW